MDMLLVGQFGRNKETTPPRFNMGDLSILDSQQNPNLLSQLKPDVVFVGLNTSIDITNLEPFSNFHPTSPYAQANYHEDHQLNKLNEIIGWLTKIYLCNTNGEPRNT